MWGILQFNKSMRQIENKKLPVRSETFIVAVGGKRSCHYCEGLLESMISRFDLLVEFKPHKRLRSSSDTQAQESHFNCK